MAFANFVWIWTKNTDKKKCNEIEKEMSNSRNNDADNHETSLKKIIHEMMEAIWTVEPKFKHSIYYCLVRY